MTLLDEILKKIRWPKKGEILFKTDKDWWNNANLDYFPLSIQLDLYAKGYKEAADIIVNHVNEEKSFQDILVFPVIFLYRHYIELILKDIIRDGYNLLGENKDFPQHHKIKELWIETRKILEKIIIDCPKTDLDAVEEIIIQFSEKDPLSMVFRYPFDKKGNKSIDDLKNVNLRHLAEIIDGLHSFLYGAQCVVGESLEYKRDMESEFIP
jgi:hypothetical protein